MIFVACLIWKKLNEQTELITRVVFSFDLLIIMKETLISMKETKQSVKESVKRLTRLDVAQRLPPNAVVVRWRLPMKLHAENVRACLTDTALLLASLTDSQRE